MIIFFENFKKTWEVSKFSKKRREKFGHISINIVSEKKQRFSFLFITPRRFTVGTILSWNNSCSLTRSKALVHERLENGRLQPCWPILARRIPLEYFVLYRRTKHLGHLSFSLSRVLFLIISGPLPLFFFFAFNHRPLYIIHQPRVPSQFKTDLIKFRFSLFSPSHSCPSSSTRASLTPTCSSNDPFVSLLSLFPSISTCGASNPSTFRFLSPPPSLSLFLSLSSFCSPSVLPIKVSHLRNTTYPLARSFFSLFPSVHKTPGVPSDLATLRGFEQPARFFLFYSSFTADFTTLVRRSDDSILARTLPPVSPLSFFTFADFFVP